MKDALQLFLMGAARCVVFPLLPFFRVKAINPDGTKYTGKLRGGAIVAANHTGFSDPLAAAVTFWYRRVYVLAAEVVMTGKLKSLGLWSLGAIPIDRNTADLQAIRRTVEILKGGHVLIIFPQGAIQKDVSQLESIKSGAVFMALQAGVPIVPMHICPLDKWYKPRFVVIGDTIYPNEICTRKIPSMADIDRATNVLMEEMNRCKACEPCKEEVK